MIDWLIILILIGEVLLLTRLDKIIYGTWITPFFLLAFPYTIVVVTAFLFGPTLGFISLYVESVLIWIVGLLLFWLGGLTIALPFSNAIRVKAKRSQPFLYEKESGKLTLILAWTTIFVMCYGLLISLGTLGWQKIATDEFAKSYGYGWVGHFKCFSMGLTVFLIGTANRKNVFSLFTIFVLIVLYMMYPVKCWVIIPILAGLIYRASSGRFKFSITKNTLFLLFIYVVFTAAYLIEFGVRNIETIYNIDTYKQLLRHFVAYIWGGALVLGEFVRAGTPNINYDPRAIFEPFVHLYAVIFSGDIVSYGTGYSSVITFDGGKTSNVLTLFGSVLCNLDFFPSIVYVLCVGGVIYGLFVIAKITTNCWAVVTCSFLGAMLVLGWFGFYFKFLSVIELPVYCAILGFLSWLFGQGYPKTKTPGKFPALSHPV